MGLGERAFKKAIHTREHRERAQPSKRAKLGLLEKHKDYVQRARDYHRKQDTLKALRVRASNRNPDEFHFGMIKSRLIDGQHRSNHVEKTKSIPADMLKLMKTQDVGYISLQRSSNLKKLKEAEEELALAELAQTRRPPQNSHVYFADDVEEKRQLLEHLHEAAIDADVSSRMAGSDAKVVMDALAELEDDPATKELKRKRAVVLARRARVEQLQKLETKLRLDRQLLGKGKRTKIGVDEYGFAKYKWALERKK